MWCGLHTLDLDRRSAVLCLYQEGSFRKKKKKKGEEGEAMHQSVRDWVGSSVCPARPRADGTGSSGANRARKT